MNRTHRKSAISKTADIILASHDLGESLLWGRYEKQLPLCAFTGNGLNCRKCFHGPCRINPFGDEPDRGVCGADRDQIVLENLFQATLEGVLETARSVAFLGGSLSDQEFPDFTPDLPRETQRRLSEKGLLPVRKSQLYEVQNSYFSHKSYLFRTLKDLTRLGLIHYGILRGRERHWATLSRDDLPFDPEGVNILIVGQAPLQALLRLRDRVKESSKGKGINLLVHSSNPIPSFLGMADHGTPELALAMNLDALIIAPNASFPALEGLAGKWELPVISMDEAKPIDQMAMMALDLALKHHQKKSYPTSFRLHPTHSRVPHPIFDQGKEIQTALKAGHIRGILVVLGETNVKQTFFERTLSLMEYGCHKNLLVIAVGELASQAELLEDELAKRMGGKLPTHSLSYLQSLYEIPRLVAFFRDLTSGKGFDRLPAVITFPEFFRTSTWATAVTFLSLGFAVQIGTRLPFWGSPTLTEVLLRDWPQISGGTILASPSLPDSQTQAQEIGSWLKTRNFQK